MYNQQVVGAAKDTTVLVEQLERKGIPSGQTYWGWLSAEDELWILAAQVELPVDAERHLTSERRAPPACFGPVSAPPRHGRSWSSMRLAAPGLLEAMKS